VTADTLIFGPVHLLAFFTYMGLASGKPWDEVKSDVKRDFLPSYMTEGIGWMIVQVRDPHGSKLFNSSVYSYCLFYFVMIY
jgi:hypothetical protein